MKRVFLDTNVLIDYLAHREPFFEEAAIIVSLAKHKKIRLYVASMSFAAASYILEKHYNNDFSIVKRVILKFMGWCRAVVIDERTIEEALASSFSDFEDGMQYVSAKRCKADVIVSRNTKDFVFSEIPCVEAHQFLGDLLGELK